MEKELDRISVDERIDEAREVLIDLGVDKSDPILKDITDCKIDIDRGNPKSYRPERNWDMTIYFDKNIHLYLSQYISSGHGYSKVSIIFMMYHMN